MRARWAFVAAALLVLPAGGVVAFVGEPAIGKVDRLLQEAMDRSPAFAHVRLPDAVGDEREIVHEFRWVYHGVPYSWRVGIDPRDVAEAASRPRTLDPRAYGMYVTEGDATVSRVAVGLAALADERGYGTVERANLALAFVQGLQYVPDAEGGADDYPKFPVETLADGGGDCEDTSALYSSIARALGIDATLLLLDGHMAAGVRLDGVGASRTFDGWLYAETTRAGYRVGEVAWEFRHADARPLPVVKVAALDVAWQADARKWGFLVRVDVWNNGTEAARGVGMYAGATPSGDDGPWRGTFASVGDLPPGEHATRWIWVNLQPERSTTLRVLAWGEGLPTVGGDQSTGGGVTTPSAN